MRPATADDVDAIVELLAGVYEQDPYFRWMCPDGDAWPEFATAYFGFVVPLALRAQEALVEGRPDAVAIWTPPGFELVGAEDLAHARALLAAHLGERAPLVLEALLATRSHEPASAHATLVYVAVGAESQGRGIGSELLRPMLERLDAEGTAAYLVSTNPRNLPFYERAGFRVLTEISTPDGAVSTRAMWRDPGARGGAVSAVSSCS